MLGSELVTFLIGENKKPFMIHVAAIVSQSGALTDFVNKRMAESKSKMVLWEEVDEETFLRFCEFAYSGDFDLRPFLPLPQSNPFVPKKDDDEGSVKEVQERRELLLLGALPEKERIKEAFVRKKFEVAVRAGPIPQPPFSPSGSLSSYKTDSTFMSLARFYAFADSYEVRSLRGLILTKFHKEMLKRFTRFSGGCPPVMEMVKLACWTFRNTKEDDPLRELVVHYFLYCKDDIGHTEEFLTLVEMGGPFMRELWKLYHWYSVEVEFFK
jgi:hypothetical protein